MELEDRTVVAYLTAQGFEDLNFLLGLEDQLTGVAGLVENTDSFGLWLSKAGERWQRVLGVPWHYLRAIEVEPEGEPGKEIRKSIGFER